MQHHFCYLCDVFPLTRLHPVNAKHAPDAFLMHSALIRCFMAASMLPSHLQGLEAALAVGVIVLTIKATKRLFSYLEKSFFSVQHYNPLFSACMMGILISLPLEFPPVCGGLHGATADSCSYDTYTYFPTSLLVFLILKKKKKKS